MVKGNHVFDGMIAKEKSLDYFGLTWRIDGIIMKSEIYEEGCSDEEKEVTAIVAVYNKNNQMSERVIVNAKLKKGESVRDEAIELSVSEGQTVECLVLDSLTNCRKVYNTFIVE